MTPSCTRTRGARTPRSGSARRGTQRTLEATQGRISDLDQTAVVARSEIDTVTAAKRQSEQQCADFEQQQQTLHGQMRDLSLNIRLKEELIRDLSRSEQESREVALIESVGAVGVVTAHIVVASDLSSLSPTRDTAAMEIR